jgi:copper oxidase (laccase) domain-containing protein
LNQTAIDRIELHVFARIFGSEAHVANLHTQFLQIIIVDLRDFLLGHTALDFSAVVQLLADGVPEEQIHDSAICTYTQHEDFFSARRLGIRSGRILNGIVIK